MAADTLRPYSAYPGFTPDHGPQYIDTNVELAGQVVTSGFKEHLSKYFEKASAEDKARCLELLTALDLSEAVTNHAPRPSSSLGYSSPHPPAASKKKHRHKRPQTAMATMVTHGDPSRPADVYGPYTTTYHREFWGNTGDSALADRPSSTQAFQAPYTVSGPIGNSNYRAEYCMKSAPMADHVRTGTSSGNRRNNPHPTEEFMNWRIPGQRRGEKKRSAAAFNLTDEIMDRVCRGTLRSTYQADYLGAQQSAYGGQRATEAPMRSQVPYSLASNMRHSYQRPEQQDSLRGNTYRYGCNKLKNMSVNGVVPTVPARQSHLQTRTTYDRDYMANSKPPGTVNVRELGRNYASNTIAARNCGTGEDPYTMERMMASYQNSPNSRPMARLSFNRSPDPDLISPWVGPM